MRRPDRIFQSSSGVARSVFKTRGSTRSPITSGAAELRRRRVRAERFDRLARHLDDCGLGRPDVVALFAKLLFLPADERYPARRASARARTRGNISRAAPMAARLLGPAAGPFRRRGPALDRRVDPGIPQPIHRRRVARSHPDRAHLPPGIQDAMAGGGSPDEPRPESPHAPPGRRVDAERNGQARAGFAGRANLPAHRRRAAARRGVHDPRVHRPDRSSSVRRFRPRCRTWSWRGWIACRATARLRRSPPRSGASFTTRCSPPW